VVPLKRTDLNEGGLINQRKTNNTNKYRGICEIARSEDKMDKKKNTYYFTKSSTHNKKMAKRSVKDALSQ
jgi:hypothetical protein